LSSRGIFCIFGDAVHERILQEAGLQNASLVVLTLPEGNKNQLVIRDIRRHNPDVPILTRSHSPADQEALLAAGASEIIRPELEASATMIRHALGYLRLPADQASAYLARFHEAVASGQVSAGIAPTQLPDVYEVEVEGPLLADQSLRESKIRERFGVTVVAVRRGSGELVLNPPPDTVISSGDRIRVFGLRQQIENLTPVRRA
jgi:CPA2 family monovalent cation:H+ antiporter-2